MKGLGEVLSESFMDIVLQGIYLSRIRIFGKDKL